MPDLLDLIVYPVAFCAVGLVFTALELARPARRIDYRAVLRNDLAALAIYGLIFLPVAISLTDWLVPPRPSLFGALLELPLVARLVLYYVLADFGLYWMHRLMHTRHVWRVHRWHHSPPYMYWLAGIRATIPNQVLFSLPFAVVVPLLHHAPPWLLVLIFLEAFFQNNWMHMNVTWRSRWLELVFVTPRYHHIHHSNAPEHQGANLAARFTIWDRLFGTYVDPDRVDELAFGIDDAPSPVRLAVGF